MVFTKFGAPVQQDLVFELPKVDADEKDPQAEGVASTSTFEKKKKESD